MWFMTTKPCFWAALTSGAASPCGLKSPKPTFANQTPFEASSLKSLASRVGSMITDPARILTPPGRKLEKARCAVTARALTPSRSRGRPGRWTSEADIIIETPPCIEDSIQPSADWRGVQSPKTTWAWESIRPGTATAPEASMTVSASPSDSRALIVPSSTRSASTGWAASPTRPLTRPPRLRISRELIAPLRPSCRRGARSTDRGRQPRRSSRSRPAQERRGRTS